MGDMKEYFDDLNGIRKENQIHSWEDADAIFMELQIPHVRHTKFHWSCGDYDFWPSTEKFYNKKTKKKGHGLCHLLYLIPHKQCR